MCWVVFCTYIYFQFVLNTNKMSIFKIISHLVYLKEEWHRKNITYILFLPVQFSSFLLLSCVWLFTTPWITACQASLSNTNFQSLLKLTSIEFVMPSNHLNLCCPLLLMPSIFPSTRVFSNESALLIRLLKYWSFSFNISPSNEHSGLIFRMDWLDLLAVQGTQESSPTPQFKSVNSSVLSFLYSP